MARTPTMRDIAKQADVALSTVSEVLNNRPGVSPELRQRVLRAANHLGYRTKISIDSAVKANLSVIGVLTKRRLDDTMLLNPFYSQIIAGVERECQRHNVSLMYANIEVDENNRAQSWPAMLLDQRVDGVIVIGTFLEEMISDISRQAGQNIVLVDAYTSGSLSLDSVLIDNLGGAMQAVTHLIQRGHRHIGLIGSHDGSYPSIRERREGYLDALRASGIEDTYIEESHLNRSDAVASTMRLMSRAPQITAIFACNDAVAFGVMNALQALGKRIPDDVSVIGFDDIDPAQEVTPPLTTVHVDKVLMGAMAFRHLRDRVTEPDRFAISTTVSTQLIERSSVRDIQA